MERMSRRAFLALTGATGAAAGALAAGGGMHVRHREGRAVKAEGNPKHPINEGGLCARGQAALQGLYDPLCLRFPLHRPDPGRDGTRTSWRAAMEAVGQALSEAGANVAMITDLQTGALADLQKRFLAAFGSEQLLVYEPFNHEPLRAGHESLYGRDTIPDYRIDRSRFVISFAADFLETWISPVRFARQFARMHSYDGKKQRIGRMAYVGPRLSMTAANADAFLQVLPGAERWIALAMLHAIVTRGWARRDARRVAPLIERFPADRVAAVTGVPAKQIEALARAFVESEGSVALTGPTGAIGRVAQETATAAALLNHAAGRVGRTVDFSRNHALARTARREQITAFFGNLKPGDVLLALAEAAGKSVTPTDSDSTFPPFEAWLRQRWEERPLRASLRQGGLWSDPEPSGPVKLRPEVGQLRFEAPSKTPRKGEQLWLWPSLMLFDGRGRGRGWLHEAPDPTTQIAWDGFVDIHPDLAGRLGVGDGDQVKLSGKLTAPVRVTDDVADGVVAAPFGGPDRLGNVFSLLGKEDDGRMFGQVSIVKAGGGEKPLCLTATQQQHHRRVLQWVALSKLKAMRPGEGDKLRLPLPEGYDPKRDVYQPHRYQNHRWAMVVDL